MPERETDLQREERERKNEGPIWAELELILRWLVVVAHDGEDLAKGMRERKKNAWEGNRSGKGRKEREKKWRPDLVIAHDGDDWCGGGGLWRSNEGSVRGESST